MLSLSKPNLNGGNVSIIDKASKPQYADLIAINPNGEFLILLRSNDDVFEPNKWCLPGGTVEEGEAPFLAAIREFGEETNLSIDIDEVDFFKKVVKDDCTIHYFIGSYDGDNSVVLDVNEHANLKWISPNEIFDIDFLLGLKEFLLDSFDVVKGKDSFEDEVASTLYTINKALDSGDITDDVYLDAIKKLKIIGGSKVNDIDLLGKAFDGNLNEELSIDYQTYFDNAFLYQGRLYDADGIAITVDPKKIPAIVESNSTIYVADDFDSNKSKFKILEGVPRENFIKALPRIKKYIEIYNKYQGELEGEFTESQNNFNKRRLELRKIIDFNFQDGGQVASNSIINLLDTIEGELKDGVDPLLVVTFKRGNSLERRQAKVSELRDYLNKLDFEQNPKIVNLSIIDLNDYSENNFKVEHFDPDNVDNISAIDERVKRSFWKVIRDRLVYRFEKGDVGVDEFLQKIRELNDDVSVLNIDLDDGVELDHKPEILKGCLMFFPDVNLDKWKDKVESLLPKDIVVEYEFDPHITILYGIDDLKLDIERLKSLVSEYVYRNPINIKLNGISYFRNDEIDVVKIGVSDISGSLNGLNDYIRNNFAYENKFDYYNPHITLGYVNRGEGDRYLNESIDLDDYGFLTLNTGKFIYSNHNKQKTEIVDTIGYDLVKSDSDDTTK